MNSDPERSPRGPPPAAGARDAARLRLLVVVDGRYPHTGGAELQARLLCRAFRDAGHEVRVLAPLLDASHAAREVVDGVSVERIRYPRIRRLGAIVLCLRFAVRLLRERGRVDAVHVHMARNLAAVAGLLRPWLGASLTVKISGAWELEGGVLDPRLRGRPLHRLLNRWIRRADTIQCISRHTRERLVEAGYPPSRLRMIPNAVDLARFRAERRPRAGPARVAYVGRLRQVKGVAVLVDAWHLLAPRGEARLVIAGDGEERPALAAQIARLSLEGSVLLAGERADVPAVLREADVYVQPSFQEGMPNAVLEAMAAGLPVVATRVGGNEDLVTDGDNGLLVPPGSPAELARAIRRLVDDPALARRMGERARARAERYGLPSVTAQLVRAYRGEPAPDGVALAAGGIP